MEFPVLAPDTLPAKLDGALLPVVELFVASTETFCNPLARRNSAPYKSPSLRYDFIVVGPVFFFYSFLFCMFVIFCLLFSGLNNSSFLYSLSFLRYQFEIIVLFSLSK